jgi:hypothetical protein
MKTASPRKLARALPRSAKDLESRLLINPLADIGNASISGRVNLGIGLICEDIPLTFKKQGEQLFSSCCGPRLHFTINQITKDTLSKLTCIQVHLLGGCIENMLLAAQSAFSELNHPNADIYCQLRKPDDSAKEIDCKLFAQSISLPRNLEQRLTTAVYEPALLQDQANLSSWEIALANTAQFLSSSKELPTTNLEMDYNCLRLGLTFKLIST